MKPLAHLSLTAHAYWELLRYDLLLAIGGFRFVSGRMGRPMRVDSPGRADIRRMCEAIGWAAAFYWKPVLCLQNSIVTARLLRRRGIAAEVVIGCRPEPFFSHAWVEVDDRVVNDSPVYRQQLPALARL
jgi:Transglutaminase-like superfamily